MNGPKIDAPAVVHVPAGERVAEIEPGDLILVHSFSFVPKMIRFGQRLRFRGEQATYAYWNHVAIYIGPHPDDEPIPRMADQEWLIEAKGRCPVQAVPLSQYDARNYAVVRLGAASGATGAALAAMRVNAVRFCKAKIGNGYGYATIAGLALWSLTGGNLTLGLGSSFVCSGLGAEATERFGIIYERDPDGLTPAHVAQRFDVRAPA